MDKQRRREVPLTPESLAIILEHVQAALHGLKYGHVTLIVQDGRVVQIDRFEKTRVSQQSL